MRYVLSGWAWGVILVGLLLVVCRGIGLVGVDLLLLGVDLELSLWVVLCVWICLSWSRGVIVVQ